MKKKREISNATLENKAIHDIATIPSDLYQHIGLTLSRKAVSSWMSTCNFFAASKAMRTVRDTKLSDFIITSGYYNHTFISFNNGNYVNNGLLYGWGENYSGELGLGDTSEREVFTAISIHDLNNKITVQDIAIGRGFSVVLLSNGSLYSCGDNEHGQLGLGDNNTRNKFAGVTIPDLPDNVTVLKLVAGATYVIILLSNGTLSACGNNDSGSLGFGHENPLRFGPMTIPGLEDGITVCDVFTSEYGILVRLSNDLLYTYNLLGSNNNQFKARSIPDLGNGVTLQKVALGNGHIIVLLSNGALFGAGDNEFGQLGLGDEVNRLEFVAIRIPGLNENTKICDIILGSNYSIVHLNNGRIYGCGRNSYGQLGFGYDGDETNDEEFKPEGRNTFTAITINDLDKDTSILKIMESNSETYAFLSNGKIYGCGKNSNGILEPTISENKIYEFTCLPTLKALSLPRSKDESQQIETVNVNTL